MNKTTITVFVATILAFAGGYMILHSRSAASNKPATKNAANTQSAVQTKTSLKDLLGSGKSVMCTYSVPVASGTQTGTLYVANGLMRGQVVSGGNALYMLNDGTWNYTWGGPLGSTQGVKMKVMTAAVNTAPVQLYISLDQPLDFTCKPWTVDSAMFTAPTGVQFKEITNTMPGTSAANSVSGAVNNTANVNSNINVRKVKGDCSLCDHAPGVAAQQQCLMAMGCIAG